MPYTVRLSVRNPVNARVMSDLKVAIATQMVATNFMLMQNSVWVNNINYPYDVQQVDDANQLIYASVQN